MSYNELEQGYQKHRPNFYVGEDGVVISLEVFLLFLFFFICLYFILNETVYIIFNLYFSLIHN